MLDTRMKTTRKLGLVATVVFLISFFLPAFGKLSGFASFATCCDMFLGHDKLRILSGGWFYYSGFVISNILFVGLVGALFVTNKGRELRLIVSVVCFLQVLSWLVLHILFATKPSQIAAIKVGYYVWLVAHGLLVAAHLRKEPAESLRAIPSVPSVA